MDLSGAWSLKGSDHQPTVSIALFTDGVHEVVSEVLMKLLSEGVK
mgnify:CR=1 FL=1